MHFPGTSQEKLDTEHTEKPALGEKCVELRREFVTGENKYKHEGALGIENFVEKTDARYTDEFNTGVFHPIAEFAADRRLSYDDEDGLCDIIESRYPSYEVGYDMRGVLGVKVRDQKGGAYCFKEGSRSELILKKT